MDRGAKIVLAAMVFFIGTSFAFVFRQSASDYYTGSDANTSGGLVLRGSSFPNPQPSQGATPYWQQGDSLPPDQTATKPQKTTVLSPIDTGSPPPRLASGFSRSNNPDNSSWEAAMGHLLPETDPAGLPMQRVHKIVDGDTLEGIARRYLGDPLRHEEIFEANRHVLSSPNELPIGVVLKIPSGSRPAKPPKGLLPDRPVVPVVPVKPVE